MPFPFYTEDGLKRSDITSYVDPLYSSARTAGTSEYVSSVIGKIAVALTTSATIALARQEFDQNTIFIASMTGGGVCVALEIINKVSAAIKKLKVDELTNFVGNEANKKFITNIPPINIPDSKFSFAGVMTLFSRPGTNAPIVVPDAKSAAVIAGSDEEKGGLINRDQSSGENAANLRRYF